MKRELLGYVANVRLTCTAWENKVHFIYLLFATNFVGALTHERVHFNTAHTYPWTEYYEGILVLSVSLS